MDLFDTDNPRHRAYEARATQTWVRRANIVAEINDAATDSPLNWAVECFEIWAENQPVRVADFWELDQNGTHWNRELTPEGRAWLRRARNETALLSILQEADQEDSAG